MTCGYGPQGVRPGVPFASTHTHNSRQFPNQYSPQYPNPYPHAPPSCAPGPRGPSGPPGPPGAPGQAFGVPGHSTGYGAQPQYDQVDGQSYYPANRNSYNPINYRSSYNNADSFGGRNGGAYNTQPGPAYDAKGQNGAYDSNTYGPNQY